MVPLGRDAGQVALLLFDGIKRYCTFASKIFRERKKSSLQEEDFRCCLTYCDKKIKLFLEILFS